MKQERCEGNKTETSRTAMGPKIAPKGSDDGARGGARGKTMRLAGRAARGATWSELARSLPLFLFLFFFLSLSLSLSDSLSLSPSLPLSLSPSLSVQFKARSLSICTTNQSGKMGPAPGRFEPSKGALM